MPTPPPALAERFALIIDGLCKVIAARQPAVPMQIPIIILIWTRLRRAAVRFATLAAQVQAGTLPKPAAARRRRAISAQPGTHRAPQHAGSRKRPRLPRTFGWLIRLVPAATAFRSQLHHFLAEPEIATLLSAAPQIGRMLRPLCHMLAIRVPKCGSASNPAGPPSPSAIETERCEQEPAPISQPKPAKTAPPNPQLWPRRPPPDPSGPALDPPAVSPPALA